MNTSTSDPRDAARAFTREAAEKVGQRLNCGLLYGSVAREEFVEDVSDVNVLLLLDRVDGPVLREIGPLARRWMERARAAPMIMDADDWNRASDAFAIEIADMKSAHELLHGIDPLEDAAVRTRPLRLQAERELRGKLIHLHQGMLLSAEDSEEIGRLLVRALPSFTTYLRAVLRLADRGVPNRTEHVIEEAADVVGGSPSAFVDVWHARNRREVPQAAVESPLLAGFNTFAENLARYVDSFSMKDTE